LEEKRDVGRELANDINGRSNVSNLSNPFVACEWGGPVVHGRFGLDRLDSLDRAEMLK
jgi:hypothetical protein